MIELRNESPNTFVDISSEDFRRYDFAGGDAIVIDKPLYLSVNAGGHRLLDASGISHYVPKGWIHLCWRAKEGEPHFVK
jgi:hypothetical protein